MPQLRSSANKVQRKVFCCCLINYGVALHRTCYTIVCIVPWCPAVYKTSTASIQSVGFTVTGIPFSFSELLISFACDLWVWNMRFTGLMFGPGIFLGFAGSPTGFFGSWLLAPFDHPRHLKSRVPPLGLTGLQSGMPLLAIWASIF